MTVYDSLHSLLDYEWFLFERWTMNHCSHIELLLNYKLRLPSERSYVTTDGQSASLSWNKGPIWGLRADFCYCQTVARLLMWGALWREDGCRLQLLLALASAVILESESRGTRDHILLSQIWDFPFRRILRPAGLQSRYSTPPPHGTLCHCLIVLVCPTIKISLRTE
jgi:hypothetical protein